jgi:hypothetical protein
VVTAVVFTVKVALVAPAPMMTFAGTAPTAALLLERDTAAPPVGAGALSVTVPVEGAPPVTLLGFSVSEVRTAPAGGAGVTVSEAVCWVPPASDAEIVTVVELATARVATWNVAIVFPADTVTLAGTDAADVLLLAREITTPPLGAAPLRVTLPVEALPPFTLVGFKVSEDRAAELGGGGGGPVGGWWPPPPQEFKNSPAARSPTAAAKPGRRCEARPRQSRATQNRSQAIEIDRSSPRRAIPGRRSVR